MPETGGVTSRRRWRRVSGLGEALNRWAGEVVGEDPGMGFGRLGGPDEDAGSPDVAWARPERLECISA